MANKLSDNEIIKALECCGVNRDCVGCPKEKEPYGCYFKLCGGAFDLINRQKAEIEKLTINMNAYGLGMIRIKERAENIVYRLVKRLKDRVVSKYEYTDTRIFKELDDLVVEMEDEISDVVKGSKLTGLEKVDHSSLCETETYEGDLKG